VSGADNLARLAAVIEVAGREARQLANADAVVYATAREFGAELLTCGARFKNLPGVVLVKKNG
jgi:predicted nucleic acid-binding protein